MLIPNILAAITAVVLLTGGVQSCATDLDCSLNGICDESKTKCVCDPGWTSSNCGTLDLRPATRGTGYNYTTVTNPGDYSTKGNSSWGGHVIQDRDDPTLFHLVISQFDKGCGLSAWRPFSYVIRAESRTGPRGPYKFAQRISDSFRHNPTTFWSPADEKYLMYSIGISWDLPSKCSSSTPSGYKNTISVSSAADIRGPWTTPEYVIDGTNPAPFPLWTPEDPNSEIILAVEDMDIYSAPTFDGSLEKILTPPWNQSHYSPTWIEDPFLWRDKRGHWHSLAHYMIDITETGNKYPRVGAHLFSETLTGTWHFAKHEAYNSTVEFIDGTSIDLGRRERPKLFFSDDGDMTPLYLVNGVLGMGASGTSYTLIQPIGDGAEEYESSLGF